MRRMILPLMLLAFVGCERAAVTSDAEREADRQAVMAVFRGILEDSEEGDPQGYVSWLRDDAVMMYAEQPSVVGREAVLPFVTEFFANYTFRFEPWQSEEIQVDGNLAFHRYSGIATIEAKDGGDVVELDRKYIDILRKEGDSWKVSHHIYNTNR